MAVSRQLAAIMFTDIQGYTALMQQNEQKAVQTREKHRQIFNSTTEKYRGKILQYYGDGTLSIFDSTIDAVNCGIEMQLLFQKEPVIPVRIGIHTGDVLFSEEEIIGDGVNVASRIESLSVPGSVFISEKVYDDIKNQESIKTSVLKTFKLKNVERPMKIYAISNSGLTVPHFEDYKNDSESDMYITAEKREASMTVPGPVLATKLLVPSPRSKSVLRGRLMKKLNKSLEHKLTLLSAPPGFGKTTLVSEWVASCRCPVAWLSLDKGDNEPTRFMVYLISAIRTIMTNTGDSTLNLIQSPQPPSSEEIMTNFVNEISAIPDLFILVLDDYHIIHAESVNHIVSFLLDHLPPQMHLIITTREEPKLPLPRLRVRAQLTELGIADLRFTASESAEFLNQVMGLNLSEENIEALETSTEGWVAGLQLAALSMQGRDDIPGFISAFAGNDRYVVDYLFDEVIKNLPEQDRHFLLQTSILDRLSGPLCDALCSQEGSSMQLKALDRANLFIVSLDQKRQWYRYHHLFAEVLQARLTEEQPDQIPVLHLKASKWYEGNGMHAEALRHAIEAGDFQRSADLAELVWPVMDKSCQASTWLEWAKTIPQELLYTRPVLCVGYAWALLQCGELESGNSHLDRAEQLLNNLENMSEESAEPAHRIIVVDQEQFLTLPASIANARAYHAQASGDTSGTLKYAKQAYNLLPEDDYLKRTIPAALTGFVHWESGDLDAAYNSFKQVSDSFLTAGDLATAVGITFILADIKMAQGRLREVGAILEQTLKLVPEQSNQVPIGTESLYTGLSEVYLESGDLEAAEKYLQRSEELNKLHSSTDWNYRRCLAQARLQEARGDLERALDLLGKAEGMFLRSPLPDLRPVAALKARIWIKQDKIQKALHWQNEKGLSTVDKLSFLHEFEHLTLARLLIAQYRNKQEEETITKAVDLLERLLKGATKGERACSMIEILVQQALAYEAQGKSKSGLDALGKAISLAQPEGYVRIFIDEGDHMAHLLSEAANHKLMPEYVDKLMNQFKSENPVR